MKMLFDVGNTRIKAATSSGLNVLQPLPDCSNQALEFPPQWTTAQTPSEIYVASVASEHLCTRIDEWAKSNWQISIRRVVVEQNVDGMRTAYKNPNQLGVDRWLVALAAHHLAGKQGVCVIDAGTALTVDVVDKQGLHRGGLIAPGFSLMIKSLTQGTEQLELENISVPDIFALDTQSAISLGCADYVAGMIDRVAMRLNTLNLEVDSWFITGGQGELVNSLCNKPMTLVPDLVLQGIDIATGSKS